MGGDTLDVTIFDSGGNLFATPIMPNGLSQTGAIPHELPSQLVDSSGEIMVPYAGRIMVRGRTLAQIQEEIETKLKSKIVNPQVVVTMGTRKGGDTVSILGDVKTPSLIPLSLGGTRLLDVIAQAGGSLGKEYETMVTVNRGTTAHSALLSEIFEDPAKNIPLQFGDNVVVRVRIQRFLSFGVNGTLSAVHFNNDHLTLDEALAMVGGPDYNAANPSAILIYRLEPRTIVTEMGLSPVMENEALVPVIYRLDLTRADGFFLARNFKMRDHDVIYTTDAGSMGVLKFLHLLGGMFTPLTQFGGAAAATAGAAAIAL
jgi:polysaccharide export outer membrane protein